MKISSTTTSPFQIEANALIVGVFADESLSGAVAELDKHLGGKISRIVESQEFDPKPCQTTRLHLADGVTAPIIELVGLGPATQFNSGVAYRAFGSAAKSLSSTARKHIAVYAKIKTAPVVEAAIAGLIVGCHGSDLYRSEKKQTPFEQVSIGIDLRDAIRSGQIIGESINLTRDLVNASPDRLYPLAFAEKAQEVCSESGMEFELWNQAKLESEKCGALLAVAQGSDRKPCVAIMRYQGAESPDAPWLALAGKGVTFDSGGLSLKPSDSMITMKGDMGGAGTVVGAMQAISGLDLPINVVGLLGLVENMPSAKAFRPSDVLEARNGKTIEIINTDAEGRLVLADVLSIAVDMGVDKIIDLATLTGACLVALGPDVAGAMTNDSSWCETVRRAADTAGEQIWELPMFDEFSDQLKSDVADIKNLGTRWGGAITAGKFLENFVANVPWVHLDIAGPAFLEKPKSWMDVGGTGALVRTLVEVARTWH
ncbi:MAG: leucyl aminopeptidase [Planctomycetales bacterium]|nr:leucyl aminopeptidase [Planctomycetales bacterium]